MDDSLHYLIMANQMLVQKALLYKLKDTGQGFLIMVITGIYAILVKTLSISGGDLHGAIWTCVAYTVLLCFSLFKSAGVAKSILNAH